MLVDTHCHLGDRKFDEDRDAVVARAREAGVNQIVVVGESAPATDRAIDVARIYGLRATAGVHPHEASSWTPDVAARTEDRLAEPEVVAVGETGLDYHYDHSPRDAQRRAFADQLALAVQHGLPVVVHSRSADSDMAAMLRDTDATVVLHSFSSGREVLEAGLAIDAYFGFSGMITFKSWSDLDAVTAVADERILVETDGPYLAPVPHRGQRNEPAFVTRVAERLAALRGTDAKAIAGLTTRNAARCFALETALTPSTDD